MGFPPGTPFSSSIIQCSYRKAPVPPGRTFSWRSTPSQPGVQALPVAFAPPSGGWPLPPAVQARMETAFGANFSQVRIHVGPQPASVGAAAFTWGTNIYFAPGQYNPHVPDGQALLAHELAHVVQQRSGRVVNPLGGKTAVVQSAALEADADRTAKRVLAALAAPAPASDAIQCSRRGRSGQSGFNINFNRTNNRISGVSRRNVRRGGTNLSRGRQGSHRTAHRALESVIRNNLLGSDIPTARRNLQRVMTRLQTLRAIRNLTGQHQTNLQVVTNSINSITNVTNLTTSANQFMQFANLLPGAASSVGSLTGHGEAGNAAVLDEYEDRLRSGATQRYSRNDVAQSGWALLDYHPSSSENEATATENLYRHMVWLRNGWPNTTVDCATQIRNRLQNNPRAVFANNLGAGATGRIVTAALNAAAANNIFT
ncbi:MAG: hypothetical protein C5B56_05220 [Proteobacteria bacterium]|nr:MAG: hypothetical protein C5B56_05220 [Pseudomonadota bacterium]